MIVSVLVEVNVNKINKTFDYNVPDLLKDSIEVGKRVLVPFGKNNIEGFILEIKNNSEVKNLKNISEVIDENPILNKELLKLGKRISNENVCSLVSICQAMLTKGMKAKKNNKVSIKTRDYIVLTNNNYDNFINTSKAKKQVDIIKYLIKNKEGLKKDFSSSAVTSLIEKKLIKVISKEYYRLNNDSQLSKLNVLNAE